MPYDLTTMRLVALAYHSRRQAGDSDSPARLAAVATFREMHPEATEDESQEAVSRIVANVADQPGEWFWRGVGEPCS